MKKRYIWLGVAGAAVVATVLIAANFTVTVPPGNATANAAARCDEVRIEQRIRTDEWDNNACANVMTWAGVKVATESAADSTRDAAIASCRSTANNTYQTTMNNFGIDWPFPAVRSACGDAQTDAEFGEDCDDGTGTVGDPIPAESVDCNEDCTTSVCGDGKLNVTDGEQCDDGNTEPLDGCDASCQIE